MWADKKKKANFDKSKYPLQLPFYFSLDTKHLQDRNLSSLGR